MQLYPNILPPILGRTTVIQSGKPFVSMVREGSGRDLGDLNGEWQESTAIAAQKPVLTKLEGQVIEWFNKHGR
jgi:hypothetical protein